ncbi:D-xylose ABC transporter substrate-binding protein [Paenibacillus hunanensis]|uniref:D-xylose ABC transporter substrate-binding protein n=1 Tax=Paenibacillus hunanensis TaxID=539262 RepID=UPI002026C274|nr:D-xylose ABC transporter substrate-binding protein [Paenibacillus hunanensis]MCL9659704.1 D-xylose ABC transporter substrate-binding protein [Paenibacillus hunanensis]
MSSQRSSTYGNANIRHSYANPVKRLRIGIVLTWFFVIVSLLLVSCSNEKGASGEPNSSSIATSNSERTDTRHQYKPDAHTPTSLASKQAINSSMPGQIRIGFAMDTLVEERWKKDRDLFVKAAERMGASVVVASADSNDARQIQQAEQMIADGIDVLVLVPHNADATAAIVNRAHKAGVKVLSYDRLVKNADVDLYVSFDNEQVGRLQADAITTIVPKGKYVYIGGADTDNNAHMFKQGVFDILQPKIDSGQIRVVYDQWSKDWKPSSAFQHMREALQASHNRIDAVIVANDGTAGGVVRALQEKGLAGKIPVAGQDGDLAAAQRIVQGTQTMTVYKPIGKLANVTAELAIKLAKDEPIETTRQVNNGKIEVPSVLLSPVAVNATNIDNTLIADGFHTKEEIYGKNK